VLLVKSQIFLLFWGLQIFMILFATRFGLFYHLNEIGTSAPKRARALLSAKIGAYWRMREQTTPPKLVFIRNACCPLREVRSREFFVVSVGPSLTSFCYDYERQRSKFTFIFCKQNSFLDVVVSLTENSMKLIAQKVYRSASGSCRRQSQPSSRKQRKQYVSRPVFFDFHRTVQSGANRTTSTMQTWTITKWWSWVHPECSKAARLVHCRGTKRGAIPCPAPGMCACSLFINKPRFITTHLCQS